MTVTQARGLGAEKVGYHQSGIAAFFPPPPPPPVRGRPLKAAETRGRPRKNMPPPSTPPAPVAHGPIGSGLRIRIPVPATAQCEPEQAEVVATVGTPAAAPAPASGPDAAGKKFTHRRYVDQRINWAAGEPLERLTLAVND